VTRSGPWDLYQTAREKGRGESHHVRFLARSPAKCGPEVVVGDVRGLPRGDGKVDGEQMILASSIVWSGISIVSSRQAEA
jgi:hypothetical protein